MNRTYVPIFFDSREFLEALSGDDVKTLLLALLDYAELGVERELSDQTLRLVYLHMRNCAASSLRKYEELCKRNRINGAKGGRPKTEKTQEKGKKTEDKKEESTKEETKADEGLLFEQFWAAYPKKQDRKTAFAVWEDLSPDETLLEQILSALHWQVRSESWKKDGGLYVPMPANYLQNRRWEDEVTVTESGKRTYDIDQFDAFTFDREVKDDV